jgi:signal transduction histidine kinase
MRWICLALVAAGSVAVVVASVVEPPHGRDWLGAAVALAFVLPIDALRDIRHVASRPTEKGEPGIVVGLTVGDGLITAALLMLPIGGAALVALTARLVANLVEPVRSINTRGDRALLILGNACLFALQRLSDIILFRVIAGDDPTPTETILGATAVVASILIWNAIEQAMVDWGRREPLRFEEPRQRLLLAPLDLATFVVPTLTSHGSRAGVALGFAVALGVVFAQRQSLIATLATRDRVANEQLLAAAMLDTLEARRQTLAMEIHDGPLQTVLASKLELDRGRVSSARQRRLADALGSAATELRSMASHQFKANQSSTTFSAALLNLVESFGGGFPDGIELDDRVDGRLPDEVTVVAYQVVHEATTNAVRHAGARVLRITAESDREFVRLYVEDDGTFAGALGGDQRSHGHLGLAALRTRVAAIGGTLTLGAASSGGTSVAATLPLDPVAHMTNHRVRHR